MKLIFGKVCYHENVYLESPVDPRALVAQALFRKTKKSQKTLTCMR